VLDVRRTDFVSVPTRDHVKAAAFYEQVLGLQRNPNSHEDWIEFETGNVTLALVNMETHGRPFVPLPPGSIALRVRDVAEAKSKLEGAGVEVNEIWDSGACNGAFFNDLDGNGILLHHRYAPYPDGSSPDEQD
jgi:catechol 2,3-dioxygenase-like lactoylglutathione lyase family enzyme